MSEYLEKSKKYKGYHYSVLSHEMIQYLHDTTLKMLQIIIPIFDEYEIRYFICGGTLLGAETTGKFIPWDDDIDICILEDDYDTAIKHLIELVPDWMFVQWFSTEPNYYHGWVKVRDKNSHVYPDCPNYEQNGVWIDLYKLTLASKESVEYLLLKEHLDYLNRRYSVGDISEDEKNKRISDNKLIEKMQNCIHRNNEDHSNTDYTYIIWSASKILVDTQWCFPRKLYRFEDIDLYSFNNADQYLTRHYGDDYKHIPPEEKRRVGINRIDYNMYNEE